MFRGRGHDVGLGRKSGEDDAPVVKLRPSTVMRSSPTIWRSDSGAITMSSVIQAMDQRLWEELRGR